MGDKIKGITVEIGGDTNPLNKALKQVNAEAKGLQSELKSVDRLLKMDPGNVDLIRQKQDLLSKSIDETKVKLEALKRAKQNADRDMENGTEVNKEEYRELTREIAKTENKLKGLTKETKRFGSEAQQSLNAVGDKFRQAGEKMEGAGKAMLPVTAAIGAAGTAAVATTASFESGMSQVQATLGITKNAMSELNGESVNTMDALEELAKKMGKETAFSASQAADAINYLALAGYDTQQIYDTLPTVLDLAAAGGMDLAAASDMVTDAMSALGMQTSDADKMVDQMARTASKSNTSVSQLGEGILAIGATAKNIKGGTEELNTELGILANNGIKGAEGGTHLRNIILSLQNPTAEAAKKMKQLGVETYDSEGNMRSLNDILGDLNSAMDGMSEEDKAGIISKLFNKTDLASASALLASTGQEWSNLQQTIADSSGAAGEMADTQLDNLQGQLTILKSALEGLAISIGEILLPIISKIVEWVQALVSKLDGMSDRTKTIIVVIAAVVAAIGPLLIIIGKISTGIGAIIKIMPMLSKAMTAMTGPVGAVVIGITALIAILVTLYAKCEWFRDGVNAVLTYIKDRFAFVIDTVKTLFSAFSKLFSGDFSGFLQDIMSAAKTWLGGWAKIGKDILSGIWNGIKDGKDWLLGKIKDWCGSLLDAVKGFFKIKSPSRRFREEVGRQLPLGLGEGIKDTGPQAVKTMAELSQQILSEATKWVEDKKFYNQLTIKEELAFWEDLKTIEGLQAEELSEIDKKIYTARQAILDEEQKAVEEHVAAVESRAEALKGFAGIFDSVESDTAVSGKELLKNLENQTKVFKQWQEDLETLKERGIGGALLEELQEMGPSAAKEIRALTQLSDEELTRYGQAYAEKTMLAAQQAMDELGGIAIPIGDVSQAIKDMQGSAAYAVKTTVDTTETESAQQKMYGVIAEMIARALMEGLTYIGNSIFDAIPKEEKLVMNDKQLAQTSWEAYANEASRRGRMFAPSRSEIAAIVLSLVPKTI